MRTQEVREKTVGGDRTEKKTKQCRNSDFSKRDIILFCLNEFIENNPCNKKLDKNILSTSLGLKRSTLNVYLSKIYSEKYIDKIETDHNTEKKAIVTINSKGKERVYDLFYKIDKYYFTLGRHETVNYLKYFDVYYSISNPYYRIVLLSFYTEYYCFNLPELLDYFDKNDY